MNTTKERFLITNHLITRAERFSAINIACDRGLGSIAKLAVHSRSTGPPNLIDLA